MRIEPLVAVVVLAGVAIGWFAPDGAPPPATIVDVPATAAVVASAASAADVPAIVEATAAAVATHEPASSTGTEEIEVCGGGWVRVDGDKEQVDKSLGAIYEASRAAVRDRVFAVMRAGGDERSRAAAEYYDAGVARIRGGPKIDCRSRSDCASLFEPYLQSAEPHRDALARIATSTIDPTVYAWAYAACSRAKGASECQLINAAQ